MMSVIRKILSIKKSIVISRHRIYMITLMILELVSGLLENSLTK